MMRYGIFSMGWAYASRGSVSGSGDSCVIWDRPYPVLFPNQGLIWHESNLSCQIKPWPMVYRVLKHAYGFSDAKDLSENPTGHGYIRSFYKGLTCALVWRTDGQTVRRPLSLRSASKTGGQWWALSLFFLPFR